MKYHWHHFSGTDYNTLDRKNAIYKIVGPGKDWAKDVSRENGNYDYLMFADLDYSHPEVQADVLRWTEWIGTELPLTGMRLDATKHYSSEFQKTLIDHVRRTVGRDWFIVSEFWSANIQELQKYLAQIDYKAHLFDAALVNRLSAISRTKGGDLRLIYDRTLVKHKPENAVVCYFRGDSSTVADNLDQTFVMNHDTVSLSFICWKNCD
jgi:alpha-amylase